MLNLLRKKFLSLPGAIFDLEITHTEIESKETRERRNKENTLFSFEKKCHSRGFPITTKNTNTTNMCRGNLAKILQKSIASNSTFHNTPLANTILFLCFFKKCQLGLNLARFAKPRGVICPILPAENNRRSYWLSSNYPGRFHLFM